MNILIVVDMQNDFIDGSLGTKEAVAIVDNVANEIPKYDKVIFTRDTHYRNYLETYEGKNLPIKHCVKGSYGWEISDKLNTNNAIEANSDRHYGATLEIKRTQNVIVNKQTFGFMQWEKYIDVEDKITIVGLCTDICVISNALILRALFPEMEITILENCTAGTTESNKAIALQVARCNQIIVK